MQRAGEIASILDPAAGVHPAKIFHGDFRGLEAAQESIASDFLVRDQRGERLDVERLQFTRDPTGRAIEIEIVGRPVEHDVERLALVEIERLGPGYRNVRGTHARCNKVALVAGKNLAVRIGKDRGDEAELAKRQFNQVKTLGNRRPWVVGRWTNGVDGFKGDVHSPRRLRISVSTDSLSKPASCFTRSHHAIKSSWVMRNR